MAGKIVSIHSFRGGTGKSNTTANLASQVAMTGKRVGVVDTDIQSPGIHVLFRMEEGSMQRSLNDYLWGKCEIEEAAHDVGGRLALLRRARVEGDAGRVLRAAGALRLDDRSGGRHPHAAAQLGDEPVLPQAQSGHGELHRVRLDGEPRRPRAERRNLASSLVAGFFLPLM